MANYPSEKIWQSRDRRPTDRQTVRPHHRHTKVNFWVVCGEGFLARKRTATRVIIIVTKSRAPHFGLAKSIYKSHACQRPRCQTCEFITPLTDIRGPKKHLRHPRSFHLHFRESCVLYFLPQCSHIYIGETGRSLRSRIDEHLRSIRNNTPGFPVAQHFNSAGHSITDVLVRGMHLCQGSNIVLRELEMRLIFQLGTAQPDGLNINFKYV